MEFNKIDRKIGIDPKNLELNVFYYIVDLKAKDIHQYEFKSSKYVGYGPLNIKSMDLEFINLRTRDIVKLVDSKRSPYRYYYFKKKSEAVNFLRTYLINQINIHNTAIGKLVSILSKVSEELSV